MRPGPGPARGRRLLLSPWRAASAGTGGIIDADDVSTWQAYGPGAAEVPAAAPEAIRYTDAAGEGALAPLRLALLKATGGLDRGLAAGPVQRAAIEAACQALEAAGGGTADWATGELEAALSGRWRLLYTSAFSAGGSLGGSWPGPPSLLPVQLGPVYQRIQPRKGRLDNIVELLSPFPGLPGVTICLGHAFAVPAPGRVRITSDGAELRLRGGRGLPPLKAPKLPDGLNLSAELRSSSFDVSFVDEQLRVTRGDRSEVRVFVRA